MRTRVLARIASIAIGSALGMALLGSAVEPAAAACPNEALRQQQGVTQLPDCMALEMVTPPEKDNRPAGAIGQALAISASGDRIVFESPAALGGTSGLGSPVPGDVYVASRGSSGWNTSATAPPASYGYGWGGAGNLGFPLSFTPDLGRWLSLQTTPAQGQNGQMTLYEASLPGAWTPRSNLLVPLDGHHGSQLIKEAAWDLSGASSDFSRVFFRPANAEVFESNGIKGVNGYSTAYLPGDPQPRWVIGNADAATWNTYVSTRGSLGEPELALLARDSGGKEWGANCGAFLGGGGESVQLGGRNQGAVSADGTTSYFSTRPSQPQQNPSNPTYPRCVGTATVGLLSAGNPVIANLATAKGTGTTSETTDPDVVTAVTATSGAFEVGQTVTITGSTVAAGSTITAVEEEADGRLRITLSNPVTAGAGSGKELKAGAQPFAVGEEVTAAANCLGGLPCFARGTTITQVNGQSITVDPPPLATGLSVTLNVLAPLRVMQRNESPTGQVAIEELVDGGPAGGSDYFEGASEDQSRVYFTSSRKLAATDTDTSAECAGRGLSGKVGLGTSVGCDLYLYEELPGGGHEVVQVSAGDADAPTPGEGANVFKGITAISGDGSHVYFVAQGVLSTEPNSEGSVADAGEMNLYAYRRDATHPDGQIAFLGGLDATCTEVEGNSPDCSLLAGGTISYWSGSRAVPLKGDGHVLAFLSTAPMTANDKDGSRLDVFRYDADATPPTLDCVSCLPGEADDAGAFDVARAGRTTILANPGLEFAERYSWSSETGADIVFATAEALLPEDVDGVRSDYLWRDGQLILLPGSGTRPAVSQDGSQVAFETSAQLLPQDGDTAVDVYVARAGGGYPTTPPQVVCSGEACQAPPVAVPATQSPPSSNLRGKGNVAAPKHKGKHRKKHKGKKHRKKHKGKKHGKKHKGKNKGKRNARGGSR